jgi:GTP pyrophosphokinase
VVKSAQAKSKINQWFKNVFKDDNIEKGKELLANYCKSQSISMADIKKPEYMESVIRKYGFHDWDSVLAAVGHGGLKEGQIINKMVELYDHDHQKKLTNEEILEKIATSHPAGKLERSKGGGIVVKGMTDLSVRFSKCCSPVPGDEIIGFITRGRGISIHRTDCVNIVNVSGLETERLIEAEWQVGDDEQLGKYLVEIVIIATNRNGLLADISKELSERSIDINMVNTRTSKQGIATMQMAFETSGKEELSKVMDKIRVIEGVRSIERTSG